VAAGALALKNSLLPSEVPDAPRSDYYSQDDQTDLAQCEVFGDGVSLAISSAVHGIECGEPLARLERHDGEIDRPSVVIPLSDNSVDDNGDGGPRDHHFSEIALMFAIGVKRT
jgi:hypothetical protein